MPLTWRNVDIPRFDMRDYMTAGQGMTNAFNSLASMLHARDQRIGQEATGQGLVNVLSQDRAGLEELIRSGGVMPGQQPLDRRADMARIMEAAVGHRSTLLNQGVAGENLANLEAQTRFGEIGAEIERLERMGDPEGAARLRAEAAAQEGWGRVAPTIEGRAGAAHSGWHSRMSSDRSHERQVAQDEFNRMDANRRYGMSQARLQLEQERLAAARAPSREEIYRETAATLAEKYGNDPRGYRNDSAYQGLSKWEQHQISEDIAKLTERLEGSSPASDTVMMRDVGITQNALRNASERQAVNASSSPAQQTALSLEQHGNATRDSTRKLVDGLYPSIGFGGGSNRIINNLTQRGYSLPEISSAAQYTPRSRMGISVEKRLEETILEARRTPAETVMRQQEEATAPYQEVLGRIDAITAKINRHSNLYGTENVPPQWYRELLDAEVAGGHLMSTFTNADGSAENIVEPWRVARFGQSANVREELEREAAVARAPSAGESTEAESGSARDGYSNPASNSAQTIGGWIRGATGLDEVLPETGGTLGSDLSMIGRELVRPRSSPNTYPAPGSSTDIDLDRIGERLSAGGGVVSAAAEVGRNAPGILARGISMWGDEHRDSSSLGSSISQITDRVSGGTVNVAAIGRLSPDETQEAVAASSNPARAQVLMDKARQGEISVQERRELRRLLENR